MKPIYRWCGRALGGLVCLGLAAAAEARGEEAGKAANSGERAAGHSLHGEAFNEGPRQQAYLMNGMPEIDFPITTRSEEAQLYFAQGVGQLHGFWYFEAERSFRHASFLDTNAPMPFWGMAMANINNEKRAKEFIKRAAELKGNGDRREQLWVEGLAEYYREDGGDNKKRRQEYIKKLENLTHEYPDDVEAKAFLVFHIWDNSGRDLPITSHVAVDALLEEIFRAQPMHPAHHYRIHLWDGEKPRRGLESAAKCGQTSAGVAHMWHMPGHIFSKLHRYGDAVWQQEASARVDHAHMMRDWVMPDQIHNYAHNNQWLVENLMYIGRVREAIDLAKNMIELPRHPKYNTLDKRGRSASHGRSRLLDVLTQWELWDEIIELSETMYLEPAEDTALEARKSHALGLAFFHKGKLKEGGQAAASLESLLKKEKQARFESAEKAETKAKGEKKSNEDITKAMAEAMRGHSSALERIENFLGEAKLHEILARGDLDATRKALGEGKDFSAPKVRLARMHLIAGDKEKAEKLAKEAADGATNQVQVLANYVEVLAACGKTNEAKEAFVRLRTAGSQADLTMPALQRLAALAGAWGFPEDWRAASPPTGDRGIRPDLKKLGPFRWEPVDAPRWTLPDARGHSVSLDQYRGRPLLMIFYLGHGCIHCREQLNAFAPLTSEFEAAGISLVGISMDDSEGLKKTVTSGGGTFPFPLLSDETLRVFKQYRAFDDFEQTPLHGVFLVDGAGKARWQDISHEPFGEVKFLLGEAKRLLGLRPGVAAEAGGKPLATKAGTEESRGGAGL